MWVLVALFTLHSAVASVKRQFDREQTHQCELLFFYTVWEVCVCCACHLSTSCAVQRTKWSMLASGCHPELCILYVNISPCDWWLNLKTLCFKGVLWPHQSDTVSYVFLDLSYFVFHYALNPLFCLFHPVISSHFIYLFLSQVGYALQGSELLVFVICQKIPGVF